MSSWRAWIVFLILIGSVVVTDGLLWDMSKLSQTIGSYDGISSPIDKPLSDLLAPSLKRAELEERLSIAETFDQYISVYPKLLKQYNDMGLKEKAQKLELQLIQEHEHDHELVWKALSKHMQQAYDDNDLKQFEAYRQQYTELANKSPNRLSYNLRLANILFSCERYDEYTELLDSVISDPKASPYHLQRAAQALTLYYKRKMNKDKSAHYAKIVEKQKVLLKQQAKLNAELSKVLRKIQMKINVHNPKYPPVLPIMQKIDELPRLTQSDENRVKNLYLLLASVAPYTDKPETTRVFWDLFKSWEKFPSSIIKKIGGQSYYISATCQGAGYFLNPPSTEGALDFLQEARRLQPDGYLVPYLDGELWAYGDRSEPSPLPLYTIAYRPDQTVSIDGELTEPVYAEVQSIPSPWYMIPDTRITEIQASLPAANVPPSLRIEAKGFYTDTEMIFGFRVYEPKIDSMRRINSDFAFTSDCLEIFVDRLRNFTIADQIGISPDNVMTHLVFKDDVISTESFTIRYPAATNPASPTTPIRSSTVKKADHYVVEVAIPLALLGFQKRPKGRLVKGNIRRIRWVTAPSMIEDIPQEIREFGPNSFSSISWAKIGHGHQEHLWNFFQFE